jgi:DNA-binding MarR family transcriptional regulator
MWVRLVACYHLMESRLRTELRNGFDTTLPRFDLMSQLYRYPEGLKMRDLSRLLMVTCGNITALTDRLVDEGLIQRRDDPKDRRAYHVSLTPKGKKLFQKMAVQHERWVTSLLGDLDKAELHHFNDLLGTLKRHLTTKSRDA